MRSRRAAFALALSAVSAQASTNLALGKIFLSYHGTPPRAKVPTVAMLVERHASAEGNEAEMRRLAERLREHHLFGGVDAHERLSAEDA
jgi:hypothetical protein